MNPKQKALELIMQSPFYEMEDKKAHSRIVCFEILKFIDQRMQGWLDDDWKEWWHDVIKEINKY